MTVLNVKIGENPPRVAGDSLEVRRTVELPAGATLTKAWLTIKKDPDTADASADLQKEITGTNVAGTGAIEADGGAGTGDGYATLRFDLTPTNTTALGAGVKYTFDIQVLTAEGDIDTIEVGTIRFTQGVTDATS